MSNELKTGKLVGNWLKTDVNWLNVRKNRLKPVYSRQKVGKKSWELILGKERTRTKPSMELVGKLVENWLRMDKHWLEIGWEWAKWLETGWKRAKTGWILFDIGQKLVELGQRWVKTTGWKLVENKKKLFENMLKMGKNWFKIYWE